MSFDNQKKYFSNNNPIDFIEEYVLNDETVEILIKQSLLQAEMGCDVIAPSDMIFYEGNRYPKLTNSFLVTALVSKDVKKITFSESGKELQESLFSELNSRLRNIQASPDGLIYLMTDGPRGKLIKVVPEGL